MSRYADALHAMQSGVMMERELDIADGTPEDLRETGPKHLRVGVNSAMADQGGLVSLLIAKGVFTEAEYVDAITAAAEREAASYEQKLTERTGVSVSLR